MAFTVQFLRYFLYFSHLILIRLKYSMVVKNLPASGDVRDAGRPLCQEDPLEKKAAKHSSILAWEIPWTEIQLCSSFALSSC